MKKNVVAKVQADSLSLRFLYHTIPGRLLLKLLTKRSVSRAAGAFLDHPISRILIPIFVARCRIDMTEYEAVRYPNFNSFFCRKVKEGMRPVDMDPEHLASPCDGLLTIYPIDKGLVVPVKQSAYTVESLLRNRKLAERFEGGTCLVFRLCVDHYHRYSYPDSGFKSENRFIPGVLHTVRPIALVARPVFTENCREYTVLVTENFGAAVQMEVGAMLVGRISNDRGEGSFTRGEEKGRFLYGGSTIILLLQRDRFVPAMDIADASAAGVETPVKMGQCLGYVPKKD